MYILWLATGSLGTVAWFSLAFFAYDIGVATSWLLFMLTHLALASPDVIIDGAVTERSVFKFGVRGRINVFEIYRYILSLSLSLSAESKEMPGLQVTCSR